MMPLRFICLRPASGIEDLLEHLFHAALPCWHVQAERALDFTAI
jgi:hypothetical protein